MGELVDATRVTVSTTQKASPLTGFRAAGRRLLPQEVSGHQGEEEEQYLRWPGDLCRGLRLLPALGDGDTIQRSSFPYLPISVVAVLNSGILGRITSPLWCTWIVSGPHIVLSQRCSPLPEPVRRHRDWAASPRCPTRPCRSFCALLYLKCGWLAEPDFHHHYRPPRSYVALNASLPGVFYHGLQGATWATRTAQDVQ